MAKPKSGPKLSRRGLPVLVVPDERTLPRLKPFDPFDLREIVVAAQTSSGMTPEGVLVRCTAAQIRQVLGILGFEGGGPTDWQGAFNRLAIALLGVGHVRYTPSQSNRSAAKWDNKKQNLFLGMMLQLLETDPSESKAIHAIATDRKKWSRLPYKQRQWGIHGGTKEQSMREIALRQKWNRMKKNWPKNLEQALDLKKWPRSPLHRKLLELELGPLLGRSGGDKRKG